MDFGTKLKEQRTVHKLSQEQLADKLHIARQSISKWERSEAYPSIGMLLQLSNLFNVSVDELLKDDEHLKRNIVKEGEKIKHPKLKVFFEWLFVTGLVLLLTKLSIFALVHFELVDWDVSFIRGWAPSVIPLALMLIGGVIADELKKDVKE